MNSQIISISQYTEFTIALAIQDCPPGVINKFLFANNIVSSQWKLADPVTENNGVIYWKFTNKVIVTAEPEKISISERIDSSLLEIPQHLKIETLASQLSNVLSNFKCIGIGINFSNLIIFEENGKPATRSSVINDLIKSKFTNSPIPKPHLSSLNFTYKLLRKDAIQWLYLSIEDVQLRQELTNEKQSGILFNASFPHELFENINCRQIVDIIKNWRMDWQDYELIIKQGFLNNLHSDI